MTTTRILVAAVLATLLAGCGQPAGGDTAARAATAEVFARIDPHGPGCSVTVARGGQVMFAAGYGLADVERAIPVDASTAFDIASVGKQFTGTVVLLLAGQNRLALGDRAGRFLPGLPSWAAEVTVEQLLHQTSGLPDYVEAGLPSATTNADVLAWLRTAAPPATPAGAAYAYSNTNYVLLAEIAAAASGTPFPQLVADRVFRPLGLGMRVDPTGTAGPRAAGYGRDAPDRPWRRLDARWGQVGDGGVVATTADLARWSSQYWDPTLGGPALAAARTGGAVPTGVDLFGGLRYGAGIMLGELPDGRAVIGHEGQWGGFETSWAVVPDARLAVAVACNGTGLLDAAVPASAVLDAWLGSAPGGVQDVLERWQRESVPAGTAGGVAVTAQSGSGAAAGGAVGGPRSTDAFRLGSLTKTYVAAALLRLAEQGRVELAAPVARWVPGVPGGDRITLRQVLDQTSGLPDYLANPAWQESVLADPARAWTLREVLGLVPAGPPGPAGTFAYSNTNYVVAGLVLEAVTGTDAGRALHDLVLAPLDLRATTYGAQGRPVPDGYAVVGDAPAVPVSSVGSYRAVETTAGTAGAMVATPADVVRFGRALLEGRATGRPGWDLLRSFPDGPSYSFGLGDLTGTRGGPVRWGNIGQIPGYSAVLMLYPATGDVVAVTATDDRIAPDALVDLADRVQRSLR